MKNKKQNYFQMMDQKKQDQVSPPSKAATGASYKEIKKTPILDVMLSPAEEDAHFKACLSYALKMSADDESHIRIYMNMEKELLFDPEPDEVFQSLWQSKRLLCLIDIPRNWKHMPLHLEEEDDALDYDLDNPMERFDYLYETGMSYCED